MEIYLLYFRLEKPVPSVGWVGLLGLRVRKQFGWERDPHIWGIVCADRASVMNMWPKPPCRASHLIGSHTWFKFYGHYSKSLSNFIFDFVICKWRRITVGAWGLPTDSLPPWMGRLAPPLAGAWVQGREGLAHPSVSGSRALVHCTDGGRPLSHSWFRSLMWPICLESGCGLIVRVQSLPQNRA